MTQRKITMKFPEDEGDAFLCECEDAGVFPSQRVRSMRRVIELYGLWSEVEREDAQVKSEGKARLSDGGRKGGLSTKP